jgi:hypothetical protein
MTAWGTSYHLGAVVHYILVLSIAHRYPSCITFISNLNFCALCEAQGWVWPVFWSIFGDRALVVRADAEGDGNGGVVGAGVGEGTQGAGEALSTLYRVYLLTI